MEILHYIWQFIVLFFTYHFDGYACNPLIAPALIAGGAGLLGGLFSGIFGNKSASNANAANLQATRETNNMNMQIAAYQADANERLMMRYMDKDFQNNYALWKRQVDQEQLNWERDNAYNDPSAVMERYANAGINPYVAMSGSLGSAATTPAQSGGVPSMSTNGVTPPYGTPPTMIAPHVEPVPPVINGVLQGIESIARSADLFSKAGKQGVEIKGIKDMLPKQIEEMESKIRETNAQASYQEFQNILDQIYAPGDRNLAQNKAAAEVRELGARYLLAVEQGEVAKSDKLLKQVQEICEKEKYKQLVEQGPVILSNLKKSGELIDEEKKTQKSQQASNYASADDSRAKASYSRALEKRLDQPIDGLTLTEDEKKDLKFFMLDLRDMEHREAQVEFERIMEKYHHDNLWGNKVLRYCRDVVDNAPVAGNVANILRGIKIK